MAKSPEAGKLAAALEELNERQLGAATFDGNLVVLAGPGSGKTRVLTVRAAHLLTNSVPRRSSLAAITYTNAAADEMRDRLGRLGLPPSRRVCVSTAHAFCLNEILLNHRDLLATKLPPSIKILSERASGTLASAVLKECGLNETFDDKAALLRARRELALLGEVTESVADFAAAATAYTAALSEREALDYEEVLIRALEAVSDEDILRLVANRFTHMLVDEYQDLGLVLHEIVCKLRNAGSQVSAVGDPNQSVLGFTGASPAHLLSLCDREDFQTIELDMNYRSAASIVAAAAGFIEAGGDGQQHVRDVDGVVNHTQVTGDQAAHAVKTVDVVEEQLAAGVPPGEIAILYPRTNVFLTALVSELHRRGVQYFHDRADGLPKGPLARWVARCALRSSAPDTPGAELPLDLTIPALSSELARLAHNRGRDFRRSRGRDLADFFLSEPDVTASASEFTAGLATALALSEIVASLTEETDQEDYARLLELDSVAASNLASSISPTAVTLTTYQSSKGREFDVVIMPGLVEGNVPFWLSSGPPEWDRLPPEAAPLAEERRAFYVAVTRARNELYLVTGSGWRNKGNYWEMPDGGPSRFVLDLMEHVG